MIAPNWARLDKRVTFNRGGSLIADFLASNNSLFERNQITAAVKSEEQAKCLSKLGVIILRMDLNDEKAISESLLQRRSRNFPHTYVARVEMTDCPLVSIVIHCASAIDPTPAIHLIKALSKQKEVSGEETYCIHVNKFKFTNLATHRKIDFWLKRILGESWLAAGQIQRHKRSVRRGERIGRLLPYSKGTEYIELNFTFQ